MNTVFYSYYIALLLKGKLKAVQISFAAIVTFIIVLLNGDGVIDFITGKSNSMTSLFALLFFIYSLMNLGYAAFNTYATLPVAPKEKGEKLPHQQQKERVPEKNNNLSPILSVKNYGSGIKSSPKAAEIRSEEGIKGVSRNEVFPNPKESPIGKAINSRSARMEPSAPKLEINIESTQQFLEEEKEESHNLYSGVIDGNYTIDITDITEIFP